MRLTQLLKPSAYVRKARQLFSAPVPDDAYSADGMRLKNRNLAPLSDPKFVSAYRRGMNSGHTIKRPAGSDADIRVEYRAYVECWAASQGLLLEGDLVSCGVNTGIFPLAISEYIDLNATGRKFWLFDTYEGIPEDQAEPDELADVRRTNKSWYTDVWDIAVRNFKPFPSAQLVKGKVPDTLATVAIDKVCYLSIDMNLPLPEIAALEYFWPKLSSGAFVVFDDYGFEGHEKQHDAIDAFAVAQGVSVLTMPTGQGLIKKP